MSAELHVHCDYVMWKITFILEYTGEETKSLV